MESILKFLPFRCLVRQYLIPNGSSATDVRTWFVGITVMHNLLPFGKPTDLVIASSTCSDCNILNALWIPMIWIFGSNVDALQLLQQYSSTGAVLTKCSNPLSNLGLGLAVLSKLCPEELGTFSSGQLLLGLLAINRQ